jgi:hypothetical protein
LATNAKLLVGDVLSQFTINCNASGISPNQTITWLQSVQKSGVFAVQTDSRITISQNGSQLSFSPLNLIDEEYYGCGVFDPAINKLKLLNTFYLYIRGMNLLYKF